MKAAFYTLGCKVNQYDTEMMSHQLVKNGYEIVAFDEMADIYIINTCTVTQMSDKKSRQLISRARRRNADAIIIVCGCFSQVKPQEAAALSGVDIVLGTANRRHLLQYIESYRKQGQQLVAPADLTTAKTLEGENITTFSDKSRAIVKIEDGCRNFCSYCIIPYARGPIRSKPNEQIQSEINDLVKAGYREVVLTGIHLGSYGIDLQTTTLADVIIATAAHSGLERIRLGSLEPGTITPAFLEAVKDCDKLMPSFHLSLQSGCDTVLKRMNRKYTAAQYMSAVTMLREAFPSCSITTDVIVGFPGETDEEFIETLRFCEKIGFAKIHIFPYSPREGTPAAKMPLQILKKVKQAREQQLAKIEHHSRLSFMQQQIETTHKVLLETKLSNGCWSGYTENYLPVIAETNANLVSGQSVCVKVSGIDNDHLLCHVIK